MDNLVDILDSFQPGWGKKEYMDNFIATLRDRVIPTYSFMDSKIENGRAIFPKEWDQEVSALKEVHFLSSLCPLNMEDKKAPRKISTLQWNY